MPLLSFWIHPSLPIVGMRRVLIVGWLAWSGTACQPTASEVTVPAAPDASVLEAPPPPPPSAFLALLPPEQTAQIRSLGVPLVVPTAIPDGFQVDSVLVKPDDRFSGYTLLYRDSRDRCFVMEHTTGGVGSLPVTEFRLPISSPLLAGAADFGLNYGRYAEPAMQEQFPAPELASDWLPIEGNFYRIAGATYINKVLSPNRPCTDVTPEEALRVVESLALISDDIKGGK